MIRRAFTIIACLLLIASANAQAVDSQQRAAQLGLTFVSAPALRRPAWSGILGDIYAHNDKVERWGAATTLAHEGTHGANSVIRNRYGGLRKLNAMYVGHNLAIVINEPRVHLTEVARLLPAGMRGMTFDLYFRQSLRDWGDYTLYLFDEWSAYVNGTWTGHSRNGIGSSDAQQMAEFSVYVIAAMQAVTRAKLGYDVRQMRAAIAWMLEWRVLPLLERPGAEAGRRHWRRFCESAETDGLRQFVRASFGVEWTRQVMRF